MNLSDLNDLDFSTAGTWPLPIKIFALLIVIAAVGGIGYWYDTTEQLMELEKVERVELQKRQEFERLQKVVANLDAYRAQIEELEAMLQVMLKQLPTRTEMPDLLEDISNTGRRNGLAFELFKPEMEQPRDFYAAKPISIRARATYHQFSAFVSSIAALSRIVTVENANIVDTEAGQTDQGVPSESLLIEAKLQTYRYLDEAEQN